MIEHQQDRADFIEGLDALKLTKTPEQMSQKLLEEMGEFLVAYMEYVKMRAILPPALVVPFLKNVQEESSDVIHLFLDVANEAGYDQGQAMTAKRQKDRLRFPRGSMPVGEGETPHQVYMRRKIKLKERPPLPN